MSKIRIYEIAKNLNITSKDMVVKLNDLGFAVKSALNAVDQETADRIVSLLVRDKKVKQPPKKEEVVPLADKKKRRSTSKAAAAPQDAKQTLSLAGSLQVCQLAKLIGLKTKFLVQQQKRSGRSLTPTTDLSIEEAMEIAAEYGIDVEEVPLEIQSAGLTCDELDGGVLRPAVVTVLGHVDHGKTTLLDAIRKTSVAEREDGGITQHIGAYQVKIAGGILTFIDTPGHEAFTAMRARGAQMTDIAILVVAADDGIMPQTVEAINHARAAGVPIIVAINKIDKPNANPEKVKQELIKYDLLPESLGGETITIDISAKQHKGIDELLEMIILQAEMMELTANPNLPARGTIIESRLDKGRGPVASVLIESGTLKLGDCFVVGLQSGKVRAMIDENGKQITEASPSTPVEVNGLTGVPLPGDAFIVMRNEKQARRVCEDRQIETLEQDSSKHKRASFEELFSRLTGEQKIPMNVIIKADVQGSLEAIQDSLLKQKSAKIEVIILHAGVGTIGDTDVNLAATSNAMIIGYRVKPSGTTMNLAHQAGVSIRLYRIIYEMIEDIRAVMLGMLEPQFKEVELGQAEIKQVFAVTKVGNVAGCFVLTGKIVRTAKVRVIRDGIIITESKIDTLKHFQEDAREVSAGQECGIHIVNYNDIKEGDIIEAFTTESVEVSL